MAWLGESLANIKGQISNFTKEVLTVEDDSEDKIDTEEINSIKRALLQSQESSKRQGEEINLLRTRAVDIQEQYDAANRQSRTAIESYRELLRSKDEENSRLKEQLEYLELAFKQQVERKRLDEETENEEPIQPILQLETIPLVPIKQKCDICTETEIQTYDELFVKELEERCNSYQNDLYVLRNELMNLQHEADRAEENNAKFTQEIFEILQLGFMLDGQPVCKPSPHSKGTIITLILSTIQEISFLWKDLLEKKSTLERTVTKLSISQGHSTCAGEHEKILVDISDQIPNTSNSNISDLFNEPFFPSKIDSFGLETILEEDRSEDEPPQRCESTDLITEEGMSGVGAGSNQTRRKGTPSPATTVFSSTCSTQTEAEEELEEPTSDKESGIVSASQAHELSLLQARADNWNRDEAELMSKLEKSEERIRRLDLDLERLRSHLVDLEEQTTSEALLSEKREEQLRVQLIQLKNELSQTLQQNERSLDVREEITKLTQERNTYRTTNSNLEDQIQKLNAQLQNLHFVLEQFQREKEIEVSNIEKRLRLEMSQLEQKNEVLRRELEKEEILLERAKSGLDAASMLNSQIEEKTRSISQFKTQVKEKDGEILRLKSQMDEVTNNLDGKIDRYLIKNLVVGYFSTPGDKRNEVLRLLATVLDFNREDRQKTGLESSYSLWQFGRKTAGTLEKEKQSLSEAFIHFLENESKPKVELRMSVDEVTRRNSQSTGSPSTLMMMNSGLNDSSDGRNSPAVLGPTDGSSTSHGIPEISMSLPILNQTDRSNSILKDILNPKP